MSCCANMDIVQFTTNNFQVGKTIIGGMKASTHLNANAKSKRNIGDADLHCKRLISWTLVTEQIEESSITKEEQAN